MCVRFNVVHRPGRKLAVALLASGACTGALATTTQARIAFTPCGRNDSLACGHLTVPLDPTGKEPGTLTLAMRRRRAPVEGANSAMIALAGGPGQSAIPFTEEFAEILGPILAHRDLIVFDQRGTGQSHPLHCKAFSDSSSALTLGAAITRCAAQLGPSRSYYSTAQSVADIEAIRVAGGYEKLVLYGTSYGTKVALDYAQQYPSHVEALILDSVVAPNGPEPLHLSTLAAVPRVLRQLCAFHQCAHITDNLMRELTRLLHEMRRRPLHATVIDDRGLARHVSISSNELLEVLVAGDLDPVLRSEFPAAVRSAVLGDRAPLARLLTSPGESAASEEIDIPLYYATSCEDQRFPWNRASSPIERLKQARTDVSSLPASAIGPFSAQDVLDLSDIPACAFWPFPSTNPPEPDDAPLPDVPTLILSGADDLRTPTSEAQSVAAQIPDSHLLVVPNTGHSVLSTEPTNCAGKALQAMFKNKPIKACPNGPPPALLRPTEVAPMRLLDLPPVRGYASEPGRTLRAVLLTLGYFSRNLELQLGETLLSSGFGELPTLRSGGLRSGWSQERRGTTSFHDYSYVPGVTLTGTVGARRVDLGVAGRSAAHGTLRLGPHGEFVGVLGDTTIRLSRGRAKLLDANAASVTEQAARVQSLSR